MKFVTVALLATAASVSAAPCPVVELLTYAKSPVVKSCEAASGASLTNVAATGKLPDADVMKVVCANKDCNDAIGGLAKYAPCSLLSGADLGGLLDQFKSTCGGSAPAPGPTPAGPTPAGPTPAGPTTAPVPTSAAPKSSSPSSTSAAPSTAPGATSAAPSTTFAPRNSSGSGVSDNTVGESTTEPTNDGKSDSQFTPSSKTVPPSTKKPASSASAIVTASCAVVVAVVASLF